jgi:hypothetical protein
MLYRALSPRIHPPQTQHARIPPLGIPGDVRQHAQPVHHRPSLERSGREVALAACARRVERVGREAQDYHVREQEARGQHCRRAVGGRVEVGEGRDELREMSGEPDAKG